MLTCSRLNFVLMSVLLAWLVTTSAVVAKETAPGFSPTKPSTGVVVKTDRGYLVSYPVTIPGTNITFTMMPVPGGEFLLGSPTDEVGRNEDEGGG